MIYQIFCILLYRFGFIARTHDRPVILPEFVSVGKKKKEITWPAHDCTEVIDLFGFFFFIVPCLYVHFIFPFFFFIFLFSPRVGYTIIVVSIPGEHRKDSFECITFRYEPMLKRTRTSFFYPPFFFFPTLKQ